MDAHMMMVPVDDESMRILLGLSDEAEPTFDPADESEDEGVFADDLAFKPLCDEPETLEDVKHMLDKIIGSPIIDRIANDPSLQDEIEDELSLDDYLPFPDEVIFHNPATVIYWDDGEKTVLKCHGDDAFDERMGLMVSAVKKVSAKLKVDEHEELLKALSKLTATEMHVVADALTVVASVVDAMESPEE